MISGHGIKLFYHSLVTFPLDLTKTRLIIQGEGVNKDVAKKQYRGMMKTMASIGKDIIFLQFIIVINKWYLILV